MNLSAKLEGYLEYTAESSVVRNHIARYVRNNCVAIIVYRMVSNIGFRPQ